MKFSEISIHRPVLASMMSLAIILFGLVALPRLPVRELPDVDPPIVNVLTVYPGASAEVVETEVTERLEEAINSIEGIKVLTSESREQLSSITIEFNLARDIEACAQDVRDRVSRVRGTLPEDIEEPVVAKQDADAQPMLWVALFSDRLSTLELTGLAENLMKDRLQTVKGVSSIFIGGQKRYAIRLRLDAEKMAAHQVALADVEEALRTQSVELPSGRVEGRERELTIQTRGELKTPEEFNQLVIRRDGDAFVRLRDVGRAEEGVEDERGLARYNGKPAVGIGVVKQSKANTIDVAKAIKDEVGRIKPLLPAGVETFYAYDESIYVERSIHEVWVTLGVAFVLVVLTIFVFLRNVRSTLIPCLTVPVAVIGTFAVLMALGYSVNILTMLALVLAIGVVVDDSIVVLENIYRHIEAGLTPFEAALKGMREIGFAIIAVTLSLVAVFIPLAFQTTLTGRLLVEFAIALCGSVLISAFVALTLTPTASARILKPLHNVKHGPLFQFFERRFEHLTARYERALDWSLNHRGVVVMLSVLALVATGWIYNRLPHEFLPEEDKGRLLCLAFAPEGSTTEYTDRMVRRMEGIVDEAPEVEGFFSAVALARGGPGKANEGLMFIRMADQRERNVQDVVGGPAGFGARFWGEVEGAFAIPIIPKAIGFSFGQSFQLVLQDQDLEQLNRTVTAVAGKLRAGGYLMNVRSNFEVTKPELRVRVDRDRASALGVSVQEISRTLQVLFGGLDLSRLKLRGKEYQVIAQLARDSRLTPSDLDRLYVRGTGGRLVQLSNVVSTETGAGPNAINHYNRFRSATIEGTPVGVTLGTALDRTTALLAQDFPGLRYDWAGESEDLQSTGRSFTFIILFATVLVYMVLAAQFESLVHPFTIMIALPLAAVGAVGLLWVLQGVNGVGTMLHGWTHYAPSAPGWAHTLSSIIPRIPSMSINLFSQVGLVLLIALVTKNSILLVEFANQERARGVGAREAMRQAGLIRFRPILMTSFTTILGLLPIAIGFGAGAESRRPMGVAAVGGLLTSTFLTLIVIPVVYTLLHDLTQRRRGRPAGRAAAALLAGGLGLLALGAPSARAEDATAYDLTRCVQTALDHNFDLRKARERVQAQSGAVVTARARNRPQLGLAGQVEQQEESRVQQYGPSSPSDLSWAVDLELTQAFYTGGANQSNLRSQLALQDSALSDLESTLQDVLLQVRERYYAVLLARSEIEVQEQNIQLLQEELQSARNKLQVGAVAPFEVLRAEVALANGQTPLIRARNDHRLAVEDLRRVLGLEGPQAAALEVAGELNTRPFGLPLEQALAEALQNRPELRRLRQVVEARTAAVAAAGSGRKPRLEGYAGYGAFNDRLSDDAADELHGWKAGVRLNWSIFDSHATRGEVVQAASQKAQAQLDLDQTRQAIEVEVRRAHSSLQEATELLNATGKVVEQAEESLRLIKSRFDVGAATQLDVLDGRVALLSARLNRQRSLHDFNVALARMERAVGRGVQQQAVARETTT